jgi:OOP family OmpA-OmpF porin
MTQGKNMNRRRVIGSVATLLALGVGTVQAAPTGQNGWYAGIDVSHSRLDMGGNNIDQAFANQGITSATSLGRTDTGWGLDMGYRFGPHFALEGGYTNLGEFNYTSATTAPGVDSLQGTFKAHAWWLAPVGIVPLTDRWALFGKAGLTRVTADLSASSSTGATAPSGMSHSNAGWLLGAGTSYDFTRNVYAKLEWDRFARVGDTNTTARGNVDQLGIGIGWRF